MKNLAVTLVMLLFVGLGTSLAQNDDASTKAEVNTEVKSTSDHHCPPGCTMPCCAKKGDADAKKHCEPGCEKACCAKKADCKKDGKKHCKPGCEKACCKKGAAGDADKKEDGHEGHNHEGHDHD
ncbi:hypothetical protein ACFLR1_05190 [Bacteroidota bacterium]